METTESNSIQMVVCDMAGTTIDEDNIVYKTLHQAINQFGYNFSLEHVLTYGAGKEKKQAIESIIGTIEQHPDEDRITEIFDLFLALLEEKYDNALITPQKNAPEFFTALRNKGVRVVLNTGYNRRTAEKLINKLGWKVGVDIDALVTADDVPRNRPHPDMILHAMQLYNIPSGEQVAKVGDSKIDIAEGQNAGCRLSIGITTGAHTKEQLQSANPTFIVDNLMSILPLLD
ncbi:phosphonatase-like hydrolase [Sphingobacterium deserti]|uniref:HAD-superfamily hydrolase, subfamily IA, variant 1 n=1 Tax=Sphingobacterium deserti TaxID=1229276 RepID=A0A0B8T3C4_9SPHI|nr:phosphonatase-like hydrolase [Sphingobacterium deserti]KGE13533.1 HAD-superfamily hydrolase, subfamily IA, variant 1 [Sphingobacterium deserti]